MSIDQLDNDSLTDSEESCPLCMEKFDLDDMGFLPCPCGYRICRFCWHRLKNREDTIEVGFDETDDGAGRCPACRQVYSDVPVGFNSNLTIEAMLEQNKSKRKKKRQLNKQKQKQQEEKQKLKEILKRDEKSLAGLRVVQKNLVFVIGIPQRSQEELRREFSKFGKIHKLVIGNTNSSNLNTAYVTYTRPEDAIKTIQILNQTGNGGHLIITGGGVTTMTTAALNGNVKQSGATLRASSNGILKASLGTTKYCTHWLKNQQCPKLPDCMYLHELADQEASFTKEDMQKGKHTEYEKKLIQQYLSKLKPVNGTTNMLPNVTLNGVTNSKNDSSNMATVDTDDSQSIIASATSVNQDLNWKTKPKQEGKPRPDTRGHPTIASIVAGTVSSVPTAASVLAQGVKLSTAIRPATITSCPVSLKEKITQTILATNTNGNRDLRPELNVPIYSKFLKVQSSESDAGEEEDDDEEDDDDDNNAHGLEQENSYERQQEDEENNFVYVPNEDDEEDEAYEEENDKFRVQIKSHEVGNHQKLNDPKTRLIVDESVDNSSESSTSYSTCSSGSNRLSTVDLQEEVENNFREMQRNTRLQLGDLVLDTYGIDTNGNDDDLDFDPISISTIGLQDLIKGNDNHTFEQVENHRPAPGMHSLMHLLNSHQPPSQPSLSHLPLSGSNVSNLIQTNHLHHQNETTSLNISASPCQPLHSSHHRSNGESPLYNKFFGSGFSQLSRDISPPIAPTQPNVSHQQHQSNGESVADWRNSLRALLPNVNITFANNVSSSSSSSSSSGSAFGPVHKPTSASGVSPVLHNTNHQPIQQQFQSPQIKSVNGLSMNQHISQNLIAQHQQLLTNAQLLLQQQQIQQQQIHQQQMQQQQMHQQQQHVQALFAQQQHQQATPQSSAGAAATAATAAGVAQSGHNGMNYLSLLQQPHQQMLRQQTVASGLGQNWLGHAQHVQQQTHQSLEGQNGLKPNLTPHLSSMHRFFQSPSTMLPTNFHQESQQQQPPPGFHGNQLNGTNF